MCRQNHPFIKKLQIGIKAFVEDEKRNAGQTVDRLLFCAMIGYKVSIEEAA